MVASIKTRYGTMATIGLLAALLLACGGTEEVWACGYDFVPLAREALSENPAQSRAAGGALRAAGPVGLKTLFAVYSDDIQRHRADNTAIQDERWEKLSAVLDTVSRQRDAYASGLYWYTDWDRAKAMAQVLNKPILSLRLLGNLDDEFSCANSRFFRTVLYANAEISKFLREHFILHWQSVRPVPRVTIDFGDGRKLERTLTGNSIHYILDANGNLIDALPGLYGPGAFLRALQTTTVMLAGERLDTEAGQEALRRYHGASIQGVKKAWTDDLTRIGQPPAWSAEAVGIPQEPTGRTENGSDGGHPPAMEAARIAMSKTAVEVPILRAMGYGADTLAKATDADAWRRIAALHEDDARLDESSIALMRKQNPVGYATAEDGVRQVKDRTFLRMVREFERSIAEDTVRNEYQLHLRIHEWLADGNPPSDVTAFNERVYAELFLTPSSDPWLGLAPGHTYTALVNNGATQYQR